MLTGFDRQSLSSEDARGFMPLRVRALDLTGHNCNYRICPHTDADRKAYPCAPGRVYDFLHGWRLVLRCNSWDCEWCGPRKKARFRSELRWSMRVAKFGRGRSEASFLVTLTWRGTCAVRCGLHWRACIEAGHTKEVVGHRGRILKHSSLEAYFRRWVLGMRKRWSDLAYCRVREYTKAGVPHWHLVVMHVGSDKDRVQSAAVALWHQITKTSYIVDVRKTYADVASYLNKYLSKGFDSVPADTPDRVRRYSWSLNAVRLPRVVPRFVAVAYYARRAGWDVGDRTDFEWWFRDSAQFVSDKWCGSDGEFVKGGDCGHRGCDRIGFLSTTMVRNYEREAGAAELMRWYFGDCEYGIDLDYELWSKGEGVL